jgi:hypothetical protein
VRDPGLEAYVVAIERHLSTKRGSEHALSPPDFALARAWHTAAIPLAAVLAGIDQAFTKDPQTATLKRCARLVQKLARGAAPLPAGAAPSAAPDDLLELLEALRNGIASAVAAAPVAFELAARRLDELRDLASVAREPNWGYLRRKLVELDELVDAASFEALPPDALAALQAEAKLALRARGNAGKEARTSYLRRRARARFGLPRVAES